MNEIKSIVINNFQSHKFSVIEPAPAGQLTVIVGPSDSGKTAIIRALRWLFYNIPQGTDFIKVGNNVAKVAIKHADGQQVTRERSRKGFNRYKINDKDRYEGFGSTVPLEVQEITGVRPVQVGDLEMCLNLAEQLDGPFLGKSVSAPAKAKVLGKLAGTEEVDFAAKGVGTDIYRGRQEEKRLSDEVAKLQDELKQYDYLPELAERIAQVETLLANIKEAVERKQQLEKLLEQRVKNIKVQNTVEAQRFKLSLMILQVEPLKTRVEQQFNQYQGLWNAGVRLASSKAGLRQIISILETTAGVNDAGIVFERISQDFRKQSKLQYSRGMLFMIGKKLNYAEHVLKVTKNIDDAAVLSQKIQETKLKEDRLEGYRRKASMFVSELDLNRDKLAHLGKIGDATVLYYDSSTIFLKRNELFALRDQLLNTHLLLKENLANIEQSTIEENRCREAYKAALLTAGVCPTCGSQITEENLKEVV